MTLFFRAEILESQPFGAQGSITPAVMGSIEGVTTTDGYPVYGFLIPGGPIKRWDEVEFHAIGFYHLGEHGLYEYYLIGVDAENPPPLDCLKFYYGKIQRGDGKAVDNLLETFIMDYEIDDSEE